MITGSNLLRDSAATGGPNVPIHQIVIERYQPVFTFIGQHGFDIGNCVYSSIDTVTVSDGILKVYSYGAVGAIRPYSDRLVSGVWAGQVAISANDMAHEPGITVAIDGATIRCFWVGEADNVLYYSQSSDDGKTWAARVSVGALSSTTTFGIAATSTTRVHYVTASSGILTFGVYEYSGSWAATTGRTEIVSGTAQRRMDAIRLDDGRDFIVNQRVFAFEGLFYANGRWGEPFSVGQQKDLGDSTYSLIARARLSNVNGIYALTFVHKEGSTDEDSNWTGWFTRTAFLRSKDCRWWTHPEITPHADEVRAILHAYGDDLYLVGVDELWVSELTEMFEHENTSLKEDITNYVKSWVLNEPEQGIAIGSTIVENDNGHFDNHAILSEENKVMLTRRAGYTTSDGNELVTVCVEEVDSIEDNYGIGDKTLTVKSRDRGKWLRDTQAVDEIFLLSGLIHHDDFADTGKVAIMYGSPTIVDDDLVFTSMPKAQFALCTCGEVKDFMMMTEAWANEDSDLVGPVIRSAANPYDGLPIGEFMTVPYTIANDDLFLIKYWAPGTAGSTTLATNAAVGLGIGTGEWYRTIVRAQGARFWIFMSTDLVTYTEEIDYTAVASANLLEKGYVGAYTWCHYGSSAKYDELGVWDSEPFYTLEDIIKAYSSYAGILDFDFKDAFWDEPTATNGMSTFDYAVLVTPDSGEISSWEDITGVTPEFEPGTAVFDPLGGLTFRITLYHGSTQVGHSNVLGVDDFYTDVDIFENNGSGLGGSVYWGQPMGELPAGYALYWIHSGLPGAMWDLVTSTATASVVASQLKLLNSVAVWEHLISATAVPRNFVIEFHKEAGVGRFIFRAVDISNFYYVTWAANSIIVGKWVAGAPTVLFSLPLDGTWNTEAEVTIGVRDDYVKLWMDDEFVLGHRLGGTYDDAGYIGFGVYTTDDLYLDTIRIAELTNIVDFTSMSAGETPDQVIRRAISQKHVQMWVNHDGSLRAIRPQDNLTSTFTYDHPEDISRSRDQIDAFSHIRVVGAWEWADVIDDTLLASLGHVFRKVDNSDLMSQGECKEECDYLIGEVKSRLNQVSFGYEAMVLQEREDMIHVEHKDIDGDYRVSSLQLAFEGADFYSRITARKYL